MSLSEAWICLRYLLKCMGAVFGDPSQIAAPLTIPMRLRDDILSFLAPLERMARLLLLAEAARLPALKGAVRSPRPRQTRQRILREVPEDSTAWRVAFCAQPAIGRSAARRRAPIKRPYLYADLPSDPVPLAARFEALIRVALNPAPYAQRLARRLDRNSLKRARAKRLFRPLRPNAAPLYHALKPIFPLAEVARVRFRDTS
ncbi:MAG: hypothetical protein JNJ73_12415 [Hyphomonadaceae bacterium]|nr:hypothetical protein [Hyphomonadaceae bacterium]